MAFNEPSLRKFISAVQPGGTVFFNGAALPDGCGRPDVQFVARPFTEFADAIGDPRAGNMVMLGSFLSRLEPLPQEFVESALRRLVKSDRWLDIDRRAIARGREVSGVSS
jgi:hypothetical protein